MDIIYSDHKNNIDICQKSELHRYIYCTEAKYFIEYDSYYTKNPTTKLRNTKI